MIYNMLANQIEILKKKEKESNIDSISLDLNAYTWLFIFNLNKYKLYSQNNSLGWSPHTCAQ